MDCSHHKMRHNLHYESFTIDPKKINGAYVVDPAVISGYRLQSPSFNTTFWF